MPHMKDIFEKPIVVGSAIGDMPIRTEQTGDKRESEDAETPALSSPHQRDSFSEKSSNST